MTKSPTTLALRKLVAHPSTLGTYHILDKVKQRAFSVGSVLKSRDRVTSYRVAQDGSFQKLKSNTGTTPAKP